VSRSIAAPSNFHVSATAITQLDVPSLNKSSSSSQSCHHGLHSSQCLHYVIRVRVIKTDISFNKPGNEGVVLGFDNFFYVSKCNSLQNDVISYASMENFMISFLEQENHQLKVKQPLLENHEAYIGKEDIKGKGSDGCIGFR